MPGVQPPADQPEPVVLQLDEIPEIASPPALTEAAIRRLCAQARH